MKKIAVLLLTLTSLLSFACFAEFDIPGKATITYPTGVTKNVNFNFSLKPTNGEMYFSAGPYKMATSQAPERYSIAVLLQKNDFAWVQEFGQGYFKEFDYQLGEHNIKLTKAPNRNIKGHYELSLNGKKYLFENKTVQIVIKFNDNGIETINFEGAIKDLALEM
ncbi:hypothetical protein [Algibacillus agarilyticus]|uniref:hypothetical protein n=1 Tax=Algibacillus agarilyticus TaxID=2234133 RepID=UPI000DD0D95E|nr:hypothetical protein [Algibacillus agarilyticus]